MWEGVGSGGGEGEFMWGRVVGSGRGMGVQVGDVEGVSVGVVWGGGGGGWF